MFEELCSLENLLAAWKKFCRGKRRRTDVMIWEHGLEDNLFALREDLLVGRYHHGAYDPFTIHDPKQRLIHKALVCDRIVHQAYVNVVEPIFERRFIHDSYSCRTGKGTHAAIRRFRVLLRQASLNNTKTVYALKCDIRKYFASVDHGILLGLLERHMRDERVMELTRSILNSFSVSTGVGIPLGNVTSQLFGNVYLHELDWFVKQDLRQTYYTRFCDDFILLAPSFKDAVSMAQTIETFLSEHLLLQLHPHKIFVRTWKQGIDFLGSRLLPHATILRPKTARRMLERVHAGNVASYLGLCKHADAYDLQRTIINKIGSL